MKLCYHCNETKPFSEFYKDAKRSDGFNNKCKKCRKLYQRKQYKITTRFNKYKITRAQYQALLVEQDNSCAICKDQLIVGHIDHCHETNKIRGILCMKCNMALGLFKDSVDVIQRAADYLVHSRK